MEDKYTAVVSMLDTGAKLKIDQAHLETVIPAIGELTQFKPSVKHHHLNLGRMVLIVNGAYRGTKAILESINTDKFSVTVKLAEVSGSCQQFADITSNLRV